MYLCNDTKTFLARALPERIHEYLVEEVEDPAQGAEAMRWLQANRLDAFNSVLCALYDIACYKVGDTCFASSADPAELDQWFVSTVVGSEVDQLDSAKDIPLCPDEKSAQAMAVERLKLADWFFSHAQPQAA